eukprot:GHVU01224290.1.p2 GENE.GHVU01224290.1~~GHVU01224290.1.p2  ORF type:complete len:433 (-),score=57.83 GHVU01224290.1:2885-4183(-)
MKALLKLIQGITKIGSTYPKAAEDASELICAATTLSSNADVDAFNGKLMRLGSEYSINGETLLSLTRLASEILRQKNGVVAGSSSATLIHNGDDSSLSRTGSGGVRLEEAPVGGVGGRPSEGESDEDEEEEEEEPADSAQRQQRRKKKRAPYKFMKEVKALEAEEWMRCNTHSWVRTSGGALLKNGGRSYTYYKCNLHVGGCQKKWRTHTALDGTLTVVEKGAHTKNAVCKILPGIHPQVRHHVTRLAGLGLPPYSIKCEANSNAAEEDPNVRKASTPQVRSFLKAEAKRMRKLFPIDTLAQLREWAEQRQITENGPKWETQPRTEMFVPPGGIFTDPKAPCVVLTTKALLENAAVIVTVAVYYGIMMDGTYKLHRGGFTVLTVGTVSLERKRGKIVQSFRPIALCFAKSESESTYAVMLRAVAAGVEVLCG